jgi:hypothetical protein
LALPSQAALPLPLIGSDEKLGELLRAQPNHGGFLLDKGRYRTAVAQVTLDVIRGRRVRDGHRAVARKPEVKTASTIFPYAGAFRRAYSRAESTRRTKALHAAIRKPVYSAPCHHPPDRDLRNPTAGPRIVAKRCWRDRNQTPGKVCEQADDADVGFAADGFLDQPAGQP